MSLELIDVPLEKGSLDHRVKLKLSHKVERALNREDVGNQESHAEKIKHL